MKFTDSYIRNLKPEAKKYYKREDDGFAVRVLSSGVKTFLFIYTFDGKRREMNLGIYPDKTLADAKRDYAAAYALLHDRRNPRDPQYERDQAHDLARREREERRLAPTISSLVDEYINKHAKSFKRSWKEDERLLNKEIVTLWGDRKAQDITKRDITLLLESIVERGTPAMSNQVLKIVRKMFNFAVERDILEHTPCTGVKALAPNTRRERVLSESEIKTFWNSIDSAAFSDDIGRALKLVLLTAQRPGEVSGMHTNEIDGQWWTIPAERAKNGKANRVFLTPTAQKIIAEGIQDIKKRQEMQAMKEGRKITSDTEYEGFLFPCPHITKIQPIASHALPSAVRRNLNWPLADAKGKPLYQKDGKPATKNRLGIDQFTPHDLRRTTATFLSQLGFMDEVIDAVLNHTKQGIIRTYNLNRYDKEKQQALESWERKLNSLITDETLGKVVSIQQRRKAA